VLTPRATVPDFAAAECLDGTRACHQEMNRRLNWKRRRRLPIRRPLAKTRSFFLKRRTTHLVLSSAHRQVDLTHVENLRNLCF